MAPWVGRALIFRRREHLAVDAPVDRVGSANHWNGAAWSTRTTVSKGRSHLDRLNII